MDTDYLPYLRGASDFLELPGHGLAEGDLELPVTSLPPGWHRSRRANWVMYADPAARCPPSGWKVHVSCVPDRAEAVVASVLADCFEHRVTVKTLRSRALVRRSLAKYAPRSGVGKVITAYPADQERLRALVDRLAVRLRGESGARPRGEVPVEGAPVSLRYGAFTAAWLETADGRLIPGRREADGVGPDPRLTPSHPTAAWPEWITALAAAASERERTATLPLREPRLLHRSSAGSVYAATWSDGRSVVVKEARHHCGYDTGGADAVGRLHHERRVLDRVAPLGLGPAVVDLRTVGESDFLVMEFLEGPTMTELQAGSHPGVVPGRQDPAGYLATVTSLTGRLREALSRLHDAGVVHGDLHPGNVLALLDPDGGPGRVVLLDWESASIDGEAVASDVRAVPVPLTPAGDLAAVRRLELLALAPVAFLADRRSELAEPMRRAAEREIDAGGMLVDLPEAHTGDETAAALIAGLRATARRADSSGVDEVPLFPGDLAQFRSPAGDVGLLHGATGVLLALAAAGCTVEPAWRTWLATRLRDLPAEARGLADGLDGIAWGLGRLGEHDLAAGVARRLHTPPQRDLAPWWGAGAVGRGVALAELAGALGESDLREQALAHLRSTTAAVRAATTPTSWRPGLLAGWAGVAVGLVRGAELLPDEAPALYDAAALAVEREVAATVAVGEGVLTRDRRSMLPYLGSGVAGLGLALEVLGVRAPALVRPGWDELRGRVETTLRTPVVLQAGLLHGRAGLLLALDRLAPGHPDVERHRARLEWHLLPARATREFAGDALAADTVALCLGDQNLRCSADLGTGAAGVLLAHLKDVDALARVLPVPARTITAN